MQLPSECPALLPAQHSVTQPCLGLLEPGHMPPWLPVIYHSLSLSLTHTQTDRQRHTHTQTYTHARISVLAKLQEYMLTFGIETAGSR